MQKVRQNSWYLFMHYFSFVKFKKVDYNAINRTYTFVGNIANLEGVSPFEIEFVSENMYCSGWLYTGGDLNVDRDDYYEMKARTNQYFGIIGHEISEGNLLAEFIKEDSLILTNPNGILKSVSFHKLFKDLIIVRSNQRNEFVSFMKDIMRQDINYFVKKQA